MRQLRTLLLLALLLLGCGPQATRQPSPTAAGSLASPAFQPGQPIPASYTCDGQNMSPALRWAAPQQPAGSFALVVDDPDANGYTHWLIYNLPAATRELPEHVAPEPERADGSRQGRNSSGGIGYTGPCPPSGTHHYRFTLYALDAPLDLPAGATKDALLARMQGHTLEQQQLVGTYQRAAH